MARVSPSIAQWSRPMLVMTLSSGIMMLVLSSLPPSPVSITAMSTSSAANQLNAIPVVISKNERPSDGALWRKSQTYCSLTILHPPFSIIFILSLKSIRCGEV